MTEATQIHTRVLKIALAIDESRAYWDRAGALDAPPTAKQAFEETWFGGRGFAAVKVMLRNMAVRYGTYPALLQALHHLRRAPIESRRIICHWHLQLADPVYRRFSDEYLGELRTRRPDVRRDMVATWLETICPGRWQSSTKTRFASGLLSCAHSAGLVASIRDPRQLTYPPVPALALTYWVHLSRLVTYEGSLLQNPYLRSLGLDPAELDSRLASLDAITRYIRQGDIIEIELDDTDIARWAERHMRHV